jgi:uncharacterized membrane protein YhiD involved in acid resistance
MSLLGFMLGTLVFHSHPHHHGNPGAGAGVLVGTGMALAVLAAMLSVAVVIGIAVHFQIALRSQHLEAVKRAAARADSRRKRERPLANS